MPDVPRSAMVLAAGLGTRMRPITDRMPKPLVPVGGKALVDHGLDALARAGVERAVVNVHHLADMLVEHLAERHQPEIVVSDERDVLLDSGGGIANALPLLGDERFVTLNADTFWLDAPGHDNIRALAAAWDPDRMDMLALLADRREAIGHTGRGDFGFARGAAGSLRWDADGHVFAGASIVSPSIFRGDEPRAHSMRIHFDRMIESGRMHGIVLRGTWITVGTPDAIATAERAMRDHAAAPA